MSTSRILIRSAVALLIGLGMLAAAEGCRRSAPGSAKPATPPAKATGKSKRGTGADGGAKTGAAGGAAAKKSPAKSAAAGDDEQPSTKPQKKTKKPAGATGPVPAKKKVLPHPENGAAEETGTVPAKKKVPPHPENGDPSAARAPGQAPAEVTAGNTSPTAKGPPDAKSTEAAPLEPPVSANENGSKKPAGAAPPSKAKSKGKTKAGAPAPVQIEFAITPTWRKGVPPPTGLVHLFCYRVDRSENQSAMTLLSASRVPAREGRHETIISEWSAEFAVSGEGVSPPTVEVTKETIAGLPVTFVDIHGQYEPTERTEPKADYRTIGAIIEHGGEWTVIKVLGQQKIVDAEYEKIMAFIRSVRPKVE